MTLYYIYQIDKHGTPKKKMQVHAICIETAWSGSKFWFVGGTFLITSEDGKEAEIFRHNPKKVEG